MPNKPSKAYAPKAAQPATAYTSIAAPAVGTGTSDTNEDLSGYLVELEVEIQRKGWAERRSDELGFNWLVHEPRLLAGLRVASIISLAELHRWEKPVAEAFLDRWLASSKSEVSTYLACLSRRAMEELIARVRNAE